MSPLTIGNELKIETLSARGRIRTYEGVSQQIYSLPRLTTSVPWRSEPSPRIELGTSFLPRMRSTTELRRHVLPYLSLTSGVEDHILPSLWKD